MRLKNFVAGAIITDNIIENCGVYDYEFDRGEKNGEGVYVGTSSKQVNKDVVLIFCTSHVLTVWYIPPQKEVFFTIQ